MLRLSVMLLGVLLTIGAPSLAGAATAPASGVEGSWTAERADPGSAPASPATLTFTRNGNTVAGTMRAGADEMPLFDIRDVGGNLSFTLVIPGTPYVTVHYAGRRTDTALTLASADEGNGVFKLSATRVGAPPPIAVAAPPAPSRPAATVRPAAAPPVAAARSAPPAPARSAPPAASPPQPPPAPQAIGPGVPAYIGRLLGQPAAGRASQAPPPPPAPPPQPATRTASLPPPPPLRPAAPASRPPSPALRPAQPATPPAAQRAASLDGSWTAEQTAPGTAAPVAATLVFTRKDGAIAGVMHRGADELPLFEVRQAGVSVSFMLVIPGTPYVSVRYIGTLMGDELMLASLDDGQGIYMLSAHRGDAAPAELIAAAPPPEAVFSPPPQTVTASLRPPAPPPALPPTLVGPPPPAIAPALPPEPQPPPPLPQAQPPLPPAAPAAQRAGPPTLDGIWTARQANSGSAAPVEAALTFSGNVGSMRVGTDEWPLFEVKQTGREVSFTLVIPGTPYLTIHYRGTLLGDELSAMSIDEDQGAFMLDARREGAKELPAEPQIASLNPPRLPPLPVLRPTQPAEAPPAAEPMPEAVSVVAPPLALSPPEPITSPPAAGPMPEIASVAPPPPLAPPPQRAPVPSGPVAKLPLPPLRDVAASNVLKTPPMGWASRQRLGTMIDDESIRQAADGLEETGLKALGFTYVEVDDGWQGARDENGILHGSDKFPDMKGLGAYIHSKGLTFGLMTSAAPQSCAGFTGSYGHEAEDAKSFAEWSVDILIYDWCGAEKIYPSQAEMQAAYQKMGEALRASGRPIAFELSQGGELNVGSWAAKTGANLWRTGKEVEDNWQSVIDAGGTVNGAPAEPSRWSDPGLVQVGNGGMTPDEYRTHLNLWAVIGAPIVLGNDVRIMRRETVDLLSNKEVLAIDQDAIGRQGRRVSQSGNTEVWAKPLADGSTALAFINRSNTSAPAAVSWEQLGIAGPRRVRDVWWHEDIGTANNRYAVFLTAHTSLLLRMSPP